MGSDNDFGTHFISEYKTPFISQTCTLLFKVWVFFIGFLYRLRSDWQTNGMPQARQPAVL
jgi:hypothetical protein